MKRPFLPFAIVLIASLNLGATTAITGSGATFPAPLYQRWASDFGKANPAVSVNYQGVGSGAGVKDFLSNLTDFGASDVAMTDGEIAKAGGNVLMLPATAGTLVLAYNVPGLQSGLKLSRAVYAGLFLGTVKKWNDPAIAADNPGITLPDLPVTIITRSDGSGTTAVFTAHLAAINPDFCSQVGSGKSVTWPVGLAGKGNDGATALIKQTPGAVGYVEYGYAVNNRLAMASLQNKSGAFVAPTAESGDATLSAVSLPGNFRVFISDPEGANDYPIATLTWLLVKKTYADAAKAAAVKAFVSYGLTEGQATAPQLGYLILPAEVVNKVRAALETVR
jgi:phosphate transport system substrate-binding protein